MSRIDWYVIPGAGEFDSGRLKGISGLYSADRIVLADSALRDGPLVRHEMLHALVREGSHPRAFFIGRCGGVVNCSGECREKESAPPGVPGAIAMESDSLEVSVDTWPDHPGAAVLGGYVRLAVRARNPLNAPVVVAAPPPDGPFFYPGSFGWRYLFDGMAEGTDDRAWVPEMRRFAPLETKVMYYDFWVGGELPFVMFVPTGVVEFSGRYGDKRSAPKTVTIAP